MTKKQAIKKSSPSNKGLSKSNKKVIYGIGLVAVLAVVISAISIPMAANYAPTNEVAPPTPSDITRFNFYSFTTGEIVSVPINVWKYEAVASEHEEVFDIDNYDLYKTGDSDEITMDVNATCYYFVEVIGGTYASDFHLLNGAQGNMNYSYYAYHLSSTVYLNILDQTTTPITTASFNTNGNYTLLLNIPESEQSTRCQAPTYDPEDDTEKEFYSLIEGITEAFCVDINLDGDAEDTFEITIYGTFEPIVVIYQDDHCYLVFHDPIDFKEIQAIDIGMDFDGVSIEDVSSMRVMVPGDANDGISTVLTTYQTI